MSFYGNRGENDPLVTTSFILNITPATNWPVIPSEKNEMLEATPRKAMALHEAQDLIRTTAETPSNVIFKLKLQHPLVAVW